MPQVTVTNHVIMTKAANPNDFELLVKRRQGKTTVVGNLRSTEVPRGMEKVCESPKNTGDLPRTHGDIMTVKLYLQIPMALDLTVMILVGGDEVDICADDDESMSDILHTRKTFHEDTPMRYRLTRW